MNVHKNLRRILIGCCCLTAPACGERQRVDETHFTRADSVTETYLNLKDHMFETWNLMIRDDNQKLRAMNNLIHELSVSNPSLRSDLAIFEERIQRLADSRYTQETMKNLNVIEEYDFASNALVGELISLAESMPEFAYNTTLRRLVETIRTADQRVISYRLEYDRTAGHYNAFIEDNIGTLRDIETDTSVEKKPLFHMTAGE